MLFSLESDGGDHILFYLVPDAHSEIPRAQVVVGGEPVLEWEANELREAVRVAGRHESGRCGFRLDCSMLPELPSIADLEIYEATSNLLVYRRRPPGAVAKKVFRLEPHLLPMLAFERSVKPYFHYCARQIENHGLESATQMFLVARIDSIYLSGRINYKNFDFYIDSVFEPVVFLSDPHVLLAERLLVLAKLWQAGKLGALSERDAMLLEPAAAFAAELPMNDGRGLKRALRNPPEEVAVALVNPVTRLLTAKTPSEMPRPGALSTALDTIAAFTIVGVEGDEHGFRDTFAQLIGADPDSLDPPSIPGAVAQLADLLREEADVERLIDIDLDLFTAARNAHRKALQSSNATEG